jgi:hypothetical protein
MKNKLISLAVGFIFLLIMVSLIYLAISAFNADFNIAHWSRHGRFAFADFGLVLGFLFGLVGYAFTDSFLNAD